jgi:AraC-like DNA-binding protein
MASRGNSKTSGVLPSAHEHYFVHEVPDRRTPFIINVLELDRKLIEAHFHNGVEISWIPRGDALFYLEGRTYELRKNDVFFLNGALPHHTGVLSGTVFHIGYAHIDTEALLSIPQLSSGLEALRLFYARPPQSPPILRDRPDICVHLQKAKDHFHAGKGTQGKIRAWSELLMALACVMEAAGPRIDSSEQWAPDAPVKNIMHIALEYISANFNRAFKVSDIAQVCCASESSLAHTFTRAMRCSPIEYRNRIRLNFAMGKLLSTGDKIEKIAADCGFDSAAALNALFRKGTGQTPRQFRARAEIH